MTPSNLRLPVRDSILVVLNYFTFELSPFLRPYSRLYIILLLLLWYSRMVYGTRPHSNQEGVCTVSVLIMEVNSILSSSICEVLYYMYRDPIGVIEDYHVLDLQSRDIEVLNYRKII